MQRVVTLFDSKNDPPVNFTARSWCYSRLTLHPAVLLHANSAVKLLHGSKSLPEPSLSGLEAKEVPSFCVAAATRQLANV